MSPDSPLSLDARHHWTATLPVSLSFTYVSIFIRTRVAGQAMENDIFLGAQSPSLGDARGSVLLCREGRPSKVPRPPLLAATLGSFECVVTPAAADGSVFALPSAPFVAVAAHENRRDRRYAASRG